MKNATAQNTIGQNTILQKKQKMSNTKKYASKIIKTISNTRNKKHSNETMSKRTIGNKQLTELIRTKNTLKRFSWTNVNAKQFAKTTKNAKTTNQKNIVQTRLSKNTII